MSRRYFGRVVVYLADFDADDAEHAERIVSEVISELGTVDTSVSWTDCDYTVHEVTPDD